MLVNSPTGQRRIEMGEHCSIGPASGKRLGGKSQPGSPSSKNSKGINSKKLGAKEAVKDGKDRALHNSESTIAANNSIGSPGSPTHCTLLVNDDDGRVSSPHPRRRPIPVNTNKPVPLGGGHHNKDHGSPRSPKHLHHHEKKKNSGPTKRESIMVSPGRESKNNLEKNTVSITECTLVISPRSALSRSDGNSKKNWDYGEDNINVDTKRVLKKSPRSPDNNNITDDVEAYDSPQSVLRSLISGTKNGDPSSPERRHLHAGEDVACSSNRSVTCSNDAASASSAGVRSGSTSPKDHSKRTHSSVIRKSILSVIGRKATIFDRPRRSEIRKFAVWDMAVRQYYHSISMLDMEDYAVLDSMEQGGTVLDERLLELLYRDITPEDYETLCELDASVQKKTANVECLDRLEVVTEWGSAIPEADRTCGVCYMRCDEDVEENLNERIFRLPCGHIFHEACITKWLLECKNACPLCNKEIETADGEAV